MTASKSVYEVLKEHAKEDADCTCAEDSAYRMFFDLLQADPTEGSLLASADGSYVCVNHDNDANKNIRLFDNYNYTVYVPTNEAIRNLITSGALPTWEEYEANKSDAETAAFIADRIQSFLRYHIQDNSVFIKGANVSNEKFESSKLNEVTRRFYSVTVNADNNGLDVTDQLGRTVHVTKKEGFYNTICREFWISESTTPKGVRATRSLISSSNAVVHQVDDVLLFSADQQKNWYSAMRGY